MIELPEALKLPQDPDPLEAENRELLRTIESLRNALPKLTVSFAGPENPEDHATFVLPSALDSIEQEIGQKMDELRRQLPKLQAQKTVPPDPKSPASLMQAQLASLSYMDLVPAEEYERYNRDVDKYLRAYERYMRETWEARATGRRSIGFEIEIRNGGTAPAEDVDVLLHFPDGFLLFSEEDLPKQPEEPRPPRKPRSRMQMMTDSIGRIPHLDLSPPSLPAFSMPTSFSIERTQSYDVRDHFVRIKHGDKVVLPQMFLTFDSYETAVPFSCDYTIRPANLPRPITGQLHFVIEKETVSKAMDGD